MFEDGIGGALPLRHSFGLRLMKLNHLEYSGVHCSSVCGDRSGHQEEEEEEEDVDRGQGWVDNSRLVIRFAKVAAGAKEKKRRKRKEKERRMVVVLSRPVGFGSIRGKKNSNNNNNNNSNNNNDDNVHLVRP